MMILIHAFFFFYQDQRIEVFISVIQSKVDIQMQTIDILDLDHLSSLTEGFVAQDIVTIVERAIHAGCCREMALGKRPAPIQKGRSNIKDVCEISPVEGNDL